MVALTLRVYAPAAEATVRHLRSRDGGHEVDFIVERADHRVVVLEVKLGTTVVGSDVTHLHWLGDRLGADLLDAASSPPVRTRTAGQTASLSSQPRCSAGSRMGTPGAGLGLGLL